MSSEVEKSRARKRKTIDEVLRQGGQASEADYSGNDEQDGRNSKSSILKRNRLESDDSSEAELPSQFRTAGLLANAAIPKGKVFGPFAGEIIPEKKPPTNKHVFICKIHDSKNQCDMFFYAKEKSKSKCSWLNMIRSPSDEWNYNCVAYNSPNGACYCAIAEINIGDELLVYYDEEQTKKANQKGSLKRKSRRSVMKSFAILEKDVTFESTSHHSENESPEKDDEQSDSSVEREQPLFVPLPNSPEFNDPAGLFSNDGKIICRRCKKKCNTLIQFRAHVKKCKPSLIYSCSDCDFVSRDQKAYDAHIQTNHAAPRKQIEVYSCSQCDAVFKSKYELLNHKREEHNNQRVEIEVVQCNKCDAIFESKADLISHKQEEHKSTRCRACELKFPTVELLTKHHEEDHLEDGLHVKCPKCRKEFANSYVKDHIRSHDETACQCSICLKKFSSPSNMRKHKRKHSPSYTPNRGGRHEEPKKCDVCEKVFAGPKALKVHQRQHTGERPFTCPHCSWTFMQAGHMNRHIKRVHMEGIEKEIKCDVCEKAFPSIVTLGTHYSIDHKGYKPFKCRECNDSFAMQGTLLRHERNVHGLESKVPEEERRFKCKEKDCGKKFALQSELNKHIAEHTGVLPYQCDICLRHLSSTGNLRKHIRRLHLGEKLPSDLKHAGQTYDCPECDKSYSHPATLQDHVKTHTNEKNICRHCGQNFVQRSGLRKHLRCIRCPVLREQKREAGEIDEIKQAAATYSRRKTWKCDKCDKSFSGPSDFKSHQRVHTGERPYDCKICGKHFTQRGNVRKHERFVHEGVPRPRQKKHKCHQCEESFSTSGELTEHRREHTGTNPLQCPYCGMAFSQKGNLKKHITRSHTDGGTKGHLKNIEGLISRSNEESEESLTMSASEKLAKLASNAEEKTDFHSEDDEDAEESLPEAASPNVVTSNMETATTDTSASLNQLVLNLTQPNDDDKSEDSLVFQSSYEPTKSPASAQLGDASPEGETRKLIKNLSARLSADTEGQSDEMELYSLDKQPAVSLAENSPKHGPPKTTSKSMPSDGLTASRRSPDVVSPRPTSGSKIETDASGKTYVELQSRSFNKESSVSTPKKAPLILKPKADILHSVAKAVYDSVDQVSPSRNQPRNDFPAIPAMGNNFSSSLFLPGRSGSVIPNVPSASSSRQEGTYEGQQQLTHPKAKPSNPQSSQPQSSVPQTSATPKKLPPLHVLSKGSGNGSKTPALERPYLPVSPDPESRHRLPISSHPPYFPPASTDVEAFQTFIRPRFSTDHQARQPGDIMAAMMNRDFMHSAPVTSSTSPLNSLIEPRGFSIIGKSMLDD